MTVLGMVVYLLLCPMGVHLPLFSEEYSLLLWPTPWQVRQQQDCSLERAEAEHFISLSRISRASSAELPAGSDDDRRTARSCLASSCAWLILSMASRLSQCSELESSSACRPIPGEQAWRPSSERAIVSLYASIQEVHELVAINDPPAASFPLPVLR